jgi:hypothetical protein
MRNVLYRLNGLVTQMRGYGHAKSQQVKKTLSERPSRADVLHGFRLILGREPEDETVINAHMLAPSVAEFRQALLLSDEFQGKYHAMQPDTSGHPSLRMGRETLVFIHLQKTGGTSLQAMLGLQFQAERRCPIREDKLHLLSVAELGRYDFFAGHFDRSSIRCIPRNEIRTVALFREPSARLVSFYRFLRSHPTGDEFAADELIRLANELTAEEFFERPEVRTFSSVYNHYLIALGGSYSWFDHNRVSLSKADFTQALKEAKRQIRALTALGVTERFEQSVELIFKSLNMPQPPSIETLHVTDNLRKQDARFHSVDRVAMTPRLRAALEELTRYDDEIYEFAVYEFERRYAGFRPIG